MALRLWHRFAALPAGLFGGSVGFVLWLMMLPGFVALDPHPPVWLLLGYPFLLALVMGLAGLCYAALLGWLAGQPHIRCGPLVRAVLVAALLAYLSLDAVWGWWEGVGPNQLILVAALAGGLVAFAAAPRLTAPARLAGPEA